MKILWIAPIPFIEDSNAHPAPWVINLALSLVEQGIDLTILNYSDSIEEDMVRTTYKNIKLIYVKVPVVKIDLLTLFNYRIQKVKKVLKEEINNNSYDLLHIHGTEHQYEVMAIDETIPTVISIQGIMTKCIEIVPKTMYKNYIQWKLASIYEEKYMKRYMNFSCRTHWDSQYIKLQNPKAQIFMIWEMIRNEFFHDHYNQESKKILFVGGTNPFKGLKELLYAYNNSLQEANFKLIVLGNCTHEDIKNIMYKNDLFNIDLSNIDCKGMVNSEGMIEAYNDSFCLVHPSYIDNSPNSVCEAQVSGLPVIATDVGGVSSLIEDNVTGLLIGRDPSDIENAVHKLYHDKSLWDAISNMSKEVARKRHNKNTILEHTLKMYKTIIAG